jgi:heme oxygenase
MPLSAPARADDHVLASMREATRALHTEAERSGFVRELLAGRATRDGYVLWLRNLWLAYDVLERSLAAHGLAGLADPRVMRAGALAADLAVLCGPRWRDAIDVLPAGRAYAEAIEAASDARLVAHAYVRYLGDLNGGRMLARVVGRALALDDTALRYYAFAADTSALERAYRVALEDAAAGYGDTPAASDEAAKAFRHNIALSEAVQREAASIAR